MPEYFYHQPDDSGPSRDVTVTRSHSDSRKHSQMNSPDLREGVGSGEVEKLRVSELPVSVIIYRILARICAERFQPD